MTRVIWDDTGDRVFEAGLDRGVLYPPDDPGVPWNGLTDVTEDQSGADVTPLYFDGVKYFDFRTDSDYSGTLKAYTYPDEFLEFDGVATLLNGVFIDNQSIRRVFGLSYRTKVGNDLESLDYGYKIHILYNLTASPGTKSHKTESENISPEDFTWNLSGIPVDVPGFRPTMHLIIDSRFLGEEVLHGLEDILYGDGDDDPRLPTIDEIRTFVATWAILTITDNGDGTWTASGSDEVVKILDSTTFEITAPSVIFIDEDTYKVSTY